MALYQVAVRNNVTSPTFPYPLFPPISGFPSSCPDALIISQLSIWVSFRVFPFHRDYFVIKYLCVYILFMYMYIYYNNVCAISRIWYMPPPICCVYLQDMVYAYVLLLPAFFSAWKVVLSHVGPAQRTEATLIRVDLSCMPITSCVLENRHHQVY